MPSSVAAEPPNHDDPCSNAGRNTCGTLGVGFYGKNRYGIRWYGDFRGAVPGKRRTFCIDLRYWYASRAYRYRPGLPGVLRNRDGETVPPERRQRIAYALWTYGQSAKPTQQAAVALYVHSQVGDARPGEADPAPLGREVVAVYRKVAAAASRYHGPYTIDARVSDEAAVGEPVRGTLRVLSAAGNALPNVPLKLSAGGIDLPDARTNAQGVAVVSITALQAGLNRLRIQTGPLASTLPAVYRATGAAAAPNAQRLAAPSSQRMTASVSIAVRALPALRTVASAEVARRGATIFDRIVVSGLGRTRAEIKVDLFGPFATRRAIRCEGHPYWSGSVTVAGDGATRSPAVTLTKSGFYAYREQLAGSQFIDEVTTDCPLAPETSLIAPHIVAGGRVASAQASVTPKAPASRPVRVRIAAVGVDAAVVPAAIDVRQGVLAIRPDIHRAGWWQDGQVPGAASGAVLVAGHVDSREAGEGAFFALRKAHRGDEVQLETANGRTFAYRVVSLRAYRKNALPTSIYSRTGEPRLVLVTCGGPFDRASGHYRDNVVVVAVPS
ncbi:MAG TPA: sortase [Gaiellaceae bacterium]|nr:sortase [Gaiellaceae bacterium]